MCAHTEVNLTACDSNCVEEADGHKTKPQVLNLKAYTTYRNQLGRTLKTS